MLTVLKEEQRGHWLEHGEGKGRLRDETRDPLQVVLWAIVGLGPSPKSEMVASRWFRAEM